MEYGLDIIVCIRYVSAFSCAYVSKSVEPVKQLNGGERESGPQVAVEAVREDRVRGNALQERFRLTGRRLANAQLLSELPCERIQLEQHTRTLRRLYTEAMVESNVLL